jgi:ribonucleotide reductase alpha subunit
MARVSSDLQPVFHPYYLRRKKIKTSDQLDDSDFMDEEGNRWKEAFVLHPGFEDFLLQQGLDKETISSFNNEQLEDHFSRSPYSDATQKDISADQQIQLLSNIETWTDQSVRQSLTIKQGSSVNDITELIKTAHASGIKVLEIYRESFYMDDLSVSDRKE